MERITGEAALRAFADMCNDVEFRGASFAVTRHGCPVAVMGQQPRFPSALLKWLDANPPNEA